MKSLLKKISFAAIACVMVAQAQAQDATQVKVEIKGLKLDQQQTPQVQAANIVDKRWRPKNWIEIETVFDIKLARDAGGRAGSLPAMEVKFFVGLNAKNAEGKNIVLTGSLNYKDIPADNSGVALAFIAPSTLKRVLQKDNGGKNDVVAHGVDVLVGGQRVAAQSSTGTPWWEDPATKGPSDKFVFESGAVLPKNKTPFAPFWGDYDLPVAVD